MVLPVNGKHPEVDNGKQPPHENGSIAPGSSLEMTEAEKIQHISHHFRQIMLLLGLDLNDDSLQATPGRVARMYVQELFCGLHPGNRPEITLFENKYRYGQMLVEKDIAVYSCCEHHFVPIVGRAHVAYYPGAKVIGLSKINRLVQYYCRRPQVQERLTEDIAAALKAALQTEDVAVVIDAVHHCVTARGVADGNSRTFTSHYSGRFLSEAAQTKFLTFLP